MNQNRKDTVSTFVPLESLVDAGFLAKVGGLDLGTYVWSGTVRGKPLSWACLSRRLVWMAVGHEHIEPELLDWIDTAPKGAVLYDIGASNGIFALYAVACGLRVVAVEPDPTNYFLLAYNNFLNSKTSKLSLEGCYNLAISNRTRVDAMHIRSMELGGHEKILHAPRGVYGDNFVPAYTHPVLCVSLNELSSQFGIAPAGFLKIDVDGSEQLLLEGADQALKSVQSVFIEVTTQFLESFALTFFSDKGFELTAKHQVQRYDGLYNCVFNRKR